MLAAFLNQTPNDTLILVIAGAVLAGLCVVEWGTSPPPFFRAALFVLGLVLLIIGLVGMVTD